MVVGELEHDPTAFTQGLEMHDGNLYESTGAPGNRSSSIRELDRDTGRVLRRKQITEDVFAEGLTFYNDQIYQLTWQDGVAFVRVPDDLSETRRFTYTGEGWGVCYNGSTLVMSDGTAELHFRDPATFQRIGNPVTVTMRGEELAALNELECVGTSVYANVWQTDIIVKIDLVTGHVTAIADASGIGLPRPRHPRCGAQWHRLGPHHADFSHHRQGLASHLRGAIRTRLRLSSPSNSSLRDGPTSCPPIHGPPTLGCRAARGSRVDQIPSNTLLRSHLECPSLRAVREPTCSG